MMKHKTIAKYLIMMYPRYFQKPPTKCMETAYVFIYVSVDNEKISDYRIHLIYSFDPYCSIIRSYVDPAAIPTPVATLAALMPLPDRNMIIPTTPPAVTPIAVLIKPTRTENVSPIGKQKMKQKKQYSS